MTTIRRKVPTKKSNHGSATAIIWMACCMLTVMVVVALSLVIFGGGGGGSNHNDITVTGGGGGGNLPTTRTLPGSQTAVRLRGTLQDVVAKQRQQLQHALRTVIGNIPARLRQLRDDHTIVGERLREVRSGTTTVHEILSGGHLLPTSGGGGIGSNTTNSLQQQQQQSDHTPQRPMQLDEIITYLDSYIHQLHDALGEAKHATFEGVWQAYHDLTVKTLYPWDRQYLHRMPKRRMDGSVFLSLATYRDENCFNTITNAYSKAKYPEKLFVGMVQQNCHHDCKTGVLANVTIVDAPPDDDCYQLFCNSTLGRPICANRQVRVLDIDEPESLGPYAARFFASKLWYGESWFMQTDAHMTFATHWDDTSIRMLQKAPSPKPILSHYPPSETYDLDGKKDRPTSRLCGPVFAPSDLESQIVRLEGAGLYDTEKLEYPSFAPFTAAGYFVAHSDFLREVPFDPFLPWIFMGEEIIMSSRLWTAGYDIFAPNEAVVGHIYSTFLVWWLLCLMIPPNSDFHILIEIIFLFVV